MTTRAPTSWLLSGGNAWLGLGYAPEGKIAASIRLTLAVRPGMADALDAPADGFVPAADQTATTCM